MSETPDLGPINAKLLNGNEPFTYDNSETRFAIADFWRWSVSDLISNATRGRLAEFIVGIAVKTDMGVPRDEWGAYDIVSENGIKIEVKSAAYVQSWRQKQYSPIKFGIKPARYWDADTNMAKAEPKRHADVYVFCLLTEKDQSIIDPTKLEQWEFYVLPTKMLDDYPRSNSSITLKSLRKLTDGIGFDQLCEEVETAYGAQIS